MAKVSVIIPLYNKEKYIRRAIDSVLVQSVQDFEIIVVDDGSTDRSVEVVQGIKEDRIMLVQQENQGECAARNTGIDKARSDLIAILDADDAWTRQFLETVLRLRINYPNAGIYATSYETREPGGKVVRPRFKAIPAYPWEGIIPNYFKSALGAPPVCASAVMSPRVVFDSAGKFPAGEKLGGDIDMWLRIALKYPVAFSNVVGAVYYMDSASRVCLTEYSISDYKMVKTAREAISNGSVSGKDKLYLAEYIFMKEIERAGRCIIRGQSKKGRELLKESQTRYFWRKRLFFFLASFFPLGIIRTLRLLKRRLLRQA